MPRKVPRETVNRWRQLSAEGKSYKAIGKETGWDQRTVARFLKTDIRFSEPGTIRRELFKERLGHHWDMLVGESTESLRRTKGFDPWEFVEFVGKAGPHQFEIAGATVSVDDKWKVQVEVSASLERACQLLRQHLSDDVIWRSVQAWESAVSRDLVARRELYEAVEKQLRNARGWELAQTPVEPMVPTLLAGSVEYVYEVSLSEASGFSGRAIALESFHTEQGGRIDAGSRVLASAPGQKEALHKLLERVVRTMAASSEAAGAAATYRSVKSATNEVHLLLEDLRLLPYLPAVCDVCYRFAE